MHYSLGESNQRAPSSKTIGAAAYSEPTVKPLLMPPNTSGEWDSGCDRLMKKSVNVNFRLDYYNERSYKNL